MPDLLYFPGDTDASSGNSDAEARLEALDITQSFIVEAPAGSGKTGLLIQRFLKLLTADNVSDPAEVLAITFTRKATAEMRDRVLAQLTAAQQNTPTTSPFEAQTRTIAVAALAKSNHLGWQLLSYPNRLNIRTIDSISADIARSLPILSGSSGALTPTEDSAPLHQQAARRTLMQLGGPDVALSDALRLILLHRDANLSDLQTLISTMLSTRDQWGELIPLAQAELTEHSLDTEVLPRLERALDQAVCRGLTRLRNTLPPVFLQDLCQLAAEWATLSGHPTDPSPIALCASLTHPPEDKAEHLEHWNALIHLLLTKDGDFRKAKGIHKGTLKFLMEKHHREDLARLIDEVRDDDRIREALCAVSALPPAKYPPEQWPLTKALFRILSRALVELQFVFAEHAACDFAELSLQAKSALRRDSATEDLARSTGQSLQHLLCDEMQDTSTSQYELIQLLTERWDGHSQTVFLVGDPKQSIYLFRQARVERFVRTLHLARLGDLPLTVLRLTSNFRSQSTLVQDFNADFSQVFPSNSDPAQPEQVPYLPARAERPADPSLPARTWHATPLPYAEDPAARSAQRQLQDRDSAQQIRALAAAALLSPNPTTAVLVRNRSHLLAIVAAFKQAPAIPFRAVEIEPLAERQEILDLLALTRALLHPADRTAALALLRTPWCGLTLADLHLLAGLDDPTLAQTTLAELIRTRGELLSPDAIARLEPFWLILTAAHAQRGTLPLPQLVERTWQAFGAAAYASPEELLNIDRFFGLLDQLPPGTPDLELLARRLDRLHASPAVHEHAVDLMTMHGAKGLEWSTVVVPALDRSSGITRSRLLAWLEIDGSEELDDPTIAHGILAPISARGRTTAQLSAWIKSIENAREAAERKRLFYVACTRARESLHLFTSPQQKADGSLTIPAGSLLQAAWPAAEPFFAAAEPPAPTTAEVIAFPQRPAILESLAASASPRPRTIQRVATPAFTAPTLVPDKPVPAFLRPEGSFTSRGFGNTVHALLHQLTLTLSTGPAPDLETWQPRIRQLLRASGLSPYDLDRLTPRVLQALTKTLADPTGLWLLSPHPDATSESSLTQRTPDGTSQTLRLDRTFRAGTQPINPGQNLWIVDYKTGDPGGRNLQIFLEEEKLKYTAQLEAYAQAYPSEPEPIQLALFYPLIPALIHWSFSKATHGVPCPEPTSEQPHPATP